jgi:hypothetical protein
MRGAPVIRRKVKAIPTFYADTWFRSRLEARWAVFFDQLNMRWHYETQGYVVGPRLNYLPDFYLPDVETYVEVKGDVQEIRKDFLTLEHFARTKRADLLILHEVQRTKLPGARPGHPCLAGTLGGKYPARLLASLNGPPKHPAPAFRDHPDGSYEQITIRQDQPGVELVLRARFTLDRYPVDAYLVDSSIDPVARRAYLAARCSRFEHGESGPPAWLVNEGSG